MGFFCLFLPFPLMSPVWTPQGAQEEGGGGVAGMPGISDCPPLSLRLPAALPGKWEGGSGQTPEGQKTHTYTLKLTKCAKWVQGLCINLGVVEGDIRGELWANLSGLMVKGGQFAENRLFFFSLMQNWKRLIETERTWGSRGMVKWIRQRWWKFKIFTFCRRSRSGCGVSGNVLSL